VAGSSATETVESPNHGWTAIGDPIELPNVTSWQRRTLSATRHVFWGPDNNGQIDDVKGFDPDEQSLISPLMHVGSGPLTIAFQHRFAFEFTVGGTPPVQSNWDAGVVEISTDNGATWVDIGGSAYNGATTADTDAPIGANRRAFVGRNVGWPNFVPVTLNLGTTYANQDVRIRFRIGADSTTGAPGWDVDDITISGITTTPFTALVGETGVCTTLHH
jgi:hypothetical protein